MDKHWETIWPSGHTEGEHLLLLRWRRGQQRRRREGKNVAVTRPDILLLLPNQEMHLLLLWAIYMTTLFKLINVKRSHSSWYHSLVSFGSRYPWTQAGISIYLLVKTAKYFFFIVCKVSFWGGCHSSVDLSVPTNLRPWFCIPSTTSMHCFFQY